MAYIKYNITEIELSYLNELNIDTPHIVPTTLINENGSFYLNNDINGIIINNKTGSIYLKPTLDLGIYNIIIYFKTDNILLETYLNITIKPIIFYKIYSFYYKLPFEKYKPKITPTNILEEELLNFEMEVPELGIILNNKTGELSFDENLISNNYKLVINCTYKNIISKSILSFNVYPIINYDYENNTIYLDHWLLFESKPPSVNPSGGAFNIINNNLQGITIDEQSGIITIKEANAGFHTIIINYKINLVSITTTLYLYIKPIINFTNLSTDYGKKNTSDMPFVSEYGGVFEIDNKNNLYNKLSINNKTGIISIKENIDTGNYNIDIFYIINNYEIPTLFNLSVYPIFYYKTNYLKLIYGIKGTSEVPVLNEFNDGVFTLLTPIENIYINPINGIIYFDLIIDIGEYNLELNYNKNNLNKVTMFKLIILPKLEIIEPVQTININEELKDIKLYNFPEGGIFYNDLNLPIINNILKLTQFKKDINNYSITITYEFNNIKTSIDYKFNINPLFHYDNNYKNIFYGETFCSDAPYIYPDNGVFEANLPSGIILDTKTGIIKIIDKLKVNKYELEIYYIYRNIKVLTLFILEIFPIIEYPTKVFTFEYDDTLVYIKSNQPKKYPPNGTFECDTFNIDNNGIISIPKNLDVKEYIINVTYIINSIKSTINYFINVIPKKIKIMFSIKDKQYNGIVDAILRYDYKHKLLYDAKYESPNVNKNIKINIKNISIENLEINKNYVIEDTIILGNIHKNKLNIEFIGIDKIYDSNNTAYVDYKINNLLNEDIVIIENYTAIFKNINTGNISVIIKNIKLGGADCKNYYCEESYETTAFIKKKDLICTFICIDKIFNNNTTAFLKLTNLEGIINKDNVLLNYCNANYESIDVNNNIPIKIDLIVLKGKHASNYNPIVNSIITGTIIKKELLPVIICQNKIYDNNDIANIIFKDFDYEITSYEAKYNNSNIGKNKAVTVSNIQIKNTNYFIKDKLIYGDILPKSINIYFEGEDKIYDNNNNITGKIQLLDLYENEDINVEYKSYFKNINQGNNKELILTQVKLTKNSSKNYCIGEITYNKPNILQRKITIEFIGFNKIYDGTVDAFVKIKKIIDTYKNDNIKIKTYKAYFEDKNIGNQKKILITNIELENNNNNNYYIENTEVFADITVKEVNIILTATNKIYDGLTTTTILIQSIKGIYFNDNMYILNYSANFENPNIGENKSVFVNNIIFGGIDAKNYICNKIIKSNATIFKKKINIKFTNMTKNYNGDNKVELQYNIMDTITDDIKIKYYNANFINPTIGTNKEIKINKIVLEGVNSANYSVDDYTIDGDIIPTEIEINWRCYDKIFDTTNLALVQSDLDLDIEYDAYFEDVNAGNNKKVIIKILNKCIGNYILKDEYICFGNIMPLDISLPIKKLSKNYDDNNELIFDAINTFDAMNTFDTSFNILSYYSYFEDKNIGFDKKLVIQNIKIDNNNFNCVDLYVTGDILEKKIIPNILIKPKIYDTDNIAEILEYSFNESSEIKIIKYKALFESSNSGVQKVFITNIILSNKNFKCDDLETVGEILQCETIFNPIIENKEYDGLTSATITFINKNSNIEVIKYTANFSDEKVGDMKNIFIKDIKLNNCNFYCKDFITTSSIYPKLITINFTNFEKEYDNTTKTNIIIESISGFINNDLIYVNTFDSNYETNNIGINIIKINNIVLKGNNLTNYYTKNYKIKGSIVKRKLTYNITVNDKEYDNNKIAKINIILTNILEDDDIFISNYTSKYDNKQKGLDKKIIINKIILNGKSKNNYYIDNEIITTGNIT